MKIQFIKDPAQRAIIERRWSIKLLKVATAFGAMGGAMSMTGFGGRLPDWAAWVILAFAGAGGWVMGFMKQPDLPPLPKADDHG